MKPFKPEDYLTRQRAWVSNPRSPLLLTFEPAGDDESEIAWVVKGKVRDLGRYAICPHLGNTIDLLNKSLLVNDGIGMGGEAALHDLNQAMIETRYSIGGCAVKSFIPVIQGLIEYQSTRTSS